LATTVRGTYVPVEEPSTASLADIMPYGLLELLPHRLRNMK